MKSFPKLFLVLTLCAIPALAAAAPNATVMLRGSVATAGKSKSTALSGAVVTIYQAQSGGIRRLVTRTADQNGKFRLPLTISNDGGMLFAVARKGRNIELATVIGAAIPPAIVVNEMTTVASAYSLAQVFQPDWSLPDAPLVLQVAAGMAENLVSSATGLPSTVMQTSPNANETNGWRSLGTLANILANCVQNSGAACNNLFALTTPPGGAAPTTTLQAMVNLARDPARNLQALFALGEPVKAYSPNLVAADNGPNAPDKMKRLDAFTLAIKFNATGRVDQNGNELCPFGGLGNIVFDLKGYAWITNNVIQGTPDSSNCMMVLKPNGQPADGADNTPNSPIFGGGILGQGFGIGFDPSGTLWAGNFGWGFQPADFPVDANGNPAGSVSKFTPAGQALTPSYGITSNLYQTQGTVSDSQGNIWMASYGNSRVQIFPKGNPTPNAFYQDPSFPYYQDANLQPFDIRLDSDGSGWVTYTGSSTVSKFTLTKDKLVKQFTRPIGTDTSPKGMAVDSSGNAWVTAGGADAIYAYDKNGNLLRVITGGGINGPWGTQTDSKGIVWVANFGPVDQPQATLKYNVSKLCGAILSNCPAGSSLGDPLTPATGYTLPSGGDQVLLHSGVPLMSPLPQPSFKPLMRMTAVQVDMAGNLWGTNNWKPGEINDLLLNPGGDGLVIFVGLAAAVKPVLYSTPSTSPFN